jgi:hypothetical protein
MEHGSRRCVLPMRTTLDIEDDVLAAVRELARRQHTSAGQVVSRLLRSALSGQGVTAQSRGGSPQTVAGFRPFAAPAGQVVTNERIDRLRDEAGL